MPQIILHHNSLLKRLERANNVISYDLSYNIHPTAVGEYEVKYYATDILGRYAEIYGTLTIK